MGDFFAELRPRFEQVAVTGDQFAAMTVDIRERAKSVDLRLKDEVGVIEWLRDSEQSHRLEWHRNHSAYRVRW
jgi:hypothetical protein